MGIWINKKNKKRYTVPHESKKHGIRTITNATNENDGQQMVLYYDWSGKVFVREESEFYEKFIPNRDRKLC